MGPPLNRCTDLLEKPTETSQLLPPHLLSFRVLVKKTSRSSWTKPPETQIPPHLTPTASLTSPEPPPTQLKSLNLSSSASSSELRSTMRSSIRPPQLPTQVPSGPLPSPSQSQLLLQALSTTSRLTVLMLMATLSSPCSLPSTSLDSNRNVIARQSGAILSKPNDVDTFVQLL